MIRRLLEYLRPPEAAEGFRRETDRLVVSRLRVGAVLALVFIPLFLPLDYLRIPEHLAGALAIRLGGCALLLVLLGLTRLPALERRAGTLSAVGVGIISAIVLGVARFSDGAADPVYLVQAMAIVFVIMGAGLLLPVDGLTMLGLGSVPLLLQIVFTVDYDPAGNLPVLASSLIAVAIATVGARGAYLVRLGDYEGQRAKEELLRARSDLVHALSRDLSARREVEESLRKSEQKYRALFEELKDAVILTSSDGTVVDANPATLELLGFASKAEFLAADPRTIYAADRDLQFVRKTVLREGFLRDHEIDLRRRDHEKVRVVMTTSIVRDDDGAITGSRTILRDVTQRRAMEAQLRQKQKLEAVGMLAAGVAHEINNPLTYVVSDLELFRDELRRSEDPDAARLETMRRRVDEALEGAERVRQIVRDLKTFARIEEGDRVAVDVNRVLEKSIAMAAPELRYRARLDTDFGEVPSVPANEGRLTQVFLNLLINAAQSFEERTNDGNRIRVRSRAADGFVSVEIADTGQGIRPEHLERLFDPFFTTKPLGEGSGLGLSICYNIVRSYGGHIDVESRPAEGSRFVVRLPAAMPMAAARAAEPVAAPGAFPPERGRILIVDDEPLVLATTKLILGRDHEVTGVASGREALDLLDRDDRFDVILCDLMMREVSGMELHAALRERAPDLARRMVFMTGGAFTPSAQDFLLEVENPRIEKPFRATDLIELVQSTIAAA